MAFKLAVGSDHRGYEYKEFLKTYSLFSKITWHDVGAETEVLSDYPVFAHKAVDLLLNNRCDGVILLCGTGIGMAIAANRFAKVYAGVAWCEKVAIRAREEDHINVLVIPADFVSIDMAVNIVQAWCSASIKTDERYIRRLHMTDSVPQKLS